MKKILLTLCVLGLFTFATSHLSAQQRTWTFKDGNNSFRAELVNAYGDTAFFQKEEGNYIHLPISAFAHYDVARILKWAEDRDAKPSTVLMNCTGKAAKDILKQWPNKISHKELTDADVNNVPEPRIIVFLMIKSNYMSLDTTVKKLCELQETINGKDGHDMLVMAVTMLKDDPQKDVIAMISKLGGDNWLMPNQWQYDSNKDLWNPYWRAREVGILITDTDGHLLCDSDGIEADGSQSDPLDFLSKLVVPIHNIRNGEHSVPDPYINQEAVRKAIADEIAAKTSMNNPKPIVFDFSGMDPETLSLMEGQNYVFSMEVGTDGAARDVKIVKNNDMVVEQALQRAAMLWHFLPTMKEGVPEVKTVMVPLRIKAPKPQNEESNSSSQAK